MVGICSTEDTLTERVRSAPKQHRTYVCSGNSMQAKTSLQHQPYMMEPFIFQAGMVTYMRLEKPMDHLFGSKTWRNWQVSMQLGLFSMWIGQCQGQLPLWLVRICWLLEFMALLLLLVSKEPLVRCCGWPLWITILQQSSPCLDHTTTGQYKIHLLAIFIWFSSTGIVIDMHIVSIFIHLVQSWSIFIYSCILLTYFSLYTCLILLQNDYLHLFLKHKRSIWSQKNVIRLNWKKKLS